MKKENKKMAQQRRAEERKKEAQKAMCKKVITICVPILILALLFYIGIGGFSKNSTEEATTADTTTTGSESTDISNTEDTDGNDVTSEEVSYLTDETLTVKDGDTVNIDYIGYIAGEEFSGGNTNGAGTDLVIGSNSYIDDFEEQLIGAHPGDQVEVRVTFPEDYHEESLAGQEALFLTTVNGIYE